MKILKKIINILLDSLAIVTGVFSLVALAWGGIMAVIILDIDPITVVELLAALLFTSWRLLRFISGGSYERETIQYSEDHAGNADQCPEICDSLQSPLPLDGTGVQG